MSYIQIELGGELRGLKFNNAAVDCYWQKVNFKEVAASSVYATIYAGLIGNDIAKGVQDSAFDYEEVTEWIDEAEEADITKACEAFAATTAYKKRLEKIHEKVRLMQEGSDEKKNMKAA